MSASRAAERWHISDTVMKAIKVDPKNKKREPV